MPCFTGVFANIHSGGFSVYVEESISILIENPVSELKSIDQFFYRDFQEFLPLKTIVRAV